ncbi:hypothetical protein KAU86_01840 [bacterium]|nr:hypothetical protein [bacterium]MCK4436669.1 hypothetical protein [bacterium]
MELKNELQDSVRYGLDWLIHRQKLNGEFDGCGSELATAASCGRAFLITGYRRSPFHPAKLPEDRRFPCREGWRLQRNLLPGARSFCACTLWGYGIFKEVKWPG